MAGLIVTQVKHDKHYKTIDTTCVEDNNLSWQAKGLHKYLITRPENWNVRGDDLIKYSTNGRDSLSHTRKELIWNYYLYILDVKENGCFCHMQYLVFERPETNYEAIKTLIDSMAKANPNKEYKLRPSQPRTGKLQTKKTRSESISQLF